MAHDRCSMDVMNNRTFANSTTYAAKLVAMVRDDLQERREARTARKQLMRELDGYHSRADIDDLLAAVDRHEGPEAEIMRTILHSKLAHAQRGSLAG